MTAVLEQTHYTAEEYLQMERSAPHKSEFHDGQILLNPTVLIEVLSPSTEACDRGGKFAHYRKIATLSEYLLVSQDQPSIERYVRQGDVWILSEALGLEASVPLESIDCVLSLREVYDKVLDDAVNKT